MPPQHLFRLSQQSRSSELPANGLGILKGGMNKTLNRASPLGIVLKITTVLLQSPLLKRSDPNDQVVGTS